jgi:hypothetical protein
MLLAGVWLIDLRLPPQHGVTEESSAASSILHFLSIPLVMSALPFLVSIAVLGRARLLRRRIEEALAEKQPDDSARLEATGLSGRLKRAGRPLLMSLIAICLVIVGWRTVSSVQGTLARASPPEPNAVTMIASFSTGLAIWITLVIGLGAILLLLIDTELLRIDRIAGRKPPCFSDRYHS